MKTILLLLIASTAQAAPNVASSSSAFITSGASPSFSHTCNTGDNIGLFVLMAGRVATAVNNLPTSVTWTSGPSGGNVIQLTKNSTTGDSGGIILAEEWHLYGCPAGVAGTITINLVSDQGGGGNEKFRAFALSVSSVDFTQLPTSMIGASAVGVASPSMTMTATANSIFAAITEGGGSNTFTGFAVTGGTVTELFNSANGDRVAGGYSSLLAAGSHTISWASNLADYRTAIAVNIQQFIAYPTVGGALTRTFAQPVIQATGSQTSGDGSTGDTFLGSASWSLAALASGNLGTGVAFLSSNDGHPTGYACPSSYAVCILKLTTFDQATPANTVVAAGPDMSSFGVSTIPGTTTCAGRTGWNNKSRSPFVFKGQLFSPIGCPNDILFNDWAQEGLLMIPDAVHSCNYNTYTTGGNTCTSSNWSSTGDAPSSNAGYQWPSLTANPMQALQVISTGRQGDPCFDANTAPSGLPSGYVYAFATGIARFPCSAATPMDPSIWQVRKSDGSWSSTTSDMATLSINNGLNSMTLDRFHGVFVAMSDAHNSYSTAPLPWGPWTPWSPMGSTDYQFLSLIDPLLTITAGRVTGVVSLNGPGSNQGRFQYVDMGPANPVWAH